MRLGVLKFRGYVINDNRIPYTPGQPLTDADFHPEFEQKAWICASVSTWRIFHRIVLSI